MQKKFEKGSEQWMLFMDFWKFRQDFYTPDNEEKWFDDLIAEGERIYHKYENTDFSDFAKSLIVSHMNDVDNRYRKGGN